MLKKVLTSSILLASFVNVAYVNADTYEEISCSTDPVFAENSCNQCFNGGTKAVDSTVGGLSDIWRNQTWVSAVMFEELQEMPVMKALNWAEWTEDKVADKFWEFTPEVKKLKDEKQQGYVLPAWQEVNWIKSTEGSSYVLTKNDAAKGQNNGLLVYSVKVNPILESGEVSTEDSVHNECVLFKSSDAPAPKVNEKPKQLPKTWPEHYILLLLLAMFLAFGILRFKKG